MPLLRGNFSDLYLSDALPAIDFILQEEYEAFKPVYEQVFNVKDSNRSIEQSTQVSSVDAMTTVGEAEEIPTKLPVQGFDKTYTHLKYAAIIPVSQEMIDDDQYDILASNPRRLLRSAMTTVETVSANIFNNGFGDTGPDGQNFFDTDHPLLYPGAGTASNELGTPADLSMTSLKDMITLLRGTVDSAGNKVNIQARILLVPKELEFTAHELLKSALLVDSSNASVNAVNSVSERYSIMPIAWDYLTDADAWFLGGDKMDHNACFYWRKRPEIDQDEEFKTHAMLLRCIQRFSVGYSDWRGWVGTAGSG